MKQKILYRSRDLRKGRFSETGRAYIVTTVTYNRRPVFDNFHNARILIQCIGQQTELGHAQSLAFIVMPDHLHWLVQLNEAPLADLVKKVKGTSARRINQATGASGPVWQGGYHDHALRSDEDIRSLARYLVANPVRAGLVNRVWNYPHWDAIWVAP